MLLTKFNVALTESLAGRRGLDPRWLEQRFELFASWTLASVRRQTATPSAWLVFVDAATPAEYLRRLVSSTDGTASIVPIDGILTDGRIGQLVRTSLDPSVTTLITSRVDSDDALSSKYAEAVMGHGSTWRGFVNSPHGLQYTDGAILRRWDSRGPFLSMIEDLSADHPPLTAFCTEHFIARSVAPVRQMSGHPMWIQVVHGDNLANSISGVPYPRKRAERALGWSLPAGGDPPNLFDLGRALYAETRWAAGGAVQRVREVRRSLRGPEVAPS